MAADQYSGFAGIYFWRILKKIGKLGELDSYQTLDFGCGSGRLKSLYPGTVVGYDVDPRFSETADWRTVKFDTVVINQVFYEMVEQDIVAFLEGLRVVNPNATVIVGIGRRSWLNRLGAWLLRPDAHDKYRTSPEREREILLHYFRIEARISVFWMCDIYKLRFNISHRDRSDVLTY